MTTVEPPDGSAARTLFLPLEEEQAFELVKEAAELWAGGLERNGTSAELELPLMAGLRHGWAVGEVRVEPKDQGSQVQIVTQPVPYRLHRSAFFVLLMGGIGASSLLVLPFFHDLLPMMPLSLLLMLLAWFLVASRVRHRNLDDFLKLVEEMAREPEEEADEPAPLMP